MTVAILMILSILAIALLDFGKTKGHLISEGLFNILNSFKKQTTKVNLTAMIPQVDMLFVNFLEEFEDTKIISKSTDL